MPLQSFLIGILGFAILNGMFSPLLLRQASAVVILLSPGLLISSPHLVAFLAYLLGATFTVMLAGVPAALYERFTGQQESTQVSMWIWLIASMVLSLPAVFTFFSTGGF